MNFNHNMRIELKNNDVIRIKMDTNIPHRITQNATSKEIRYNYPVSEYKMSCQMQLAFALQDASISEDFRYREKVAIVIDSNFATEQDMIDPDNMDVKPLIDAISLLLLVNDTFSYVDLFLTGGVDKSKDYKTCVYIIPKRILNGLYDLLK